jgi:hypothetical protein
MKTKELFDHKVKQSGHVIHYRRLESGTCFDRDTPEVVVDRLEDARLNHYRIRIFLGDPKTGRDWGEENDIIGYIGRSGGSIQVPLLLANRRSIGGGAILDECIVKIMVGRWTVFQVPRYKCGEYEVKQTVTVPVSNDDQEAFEQGYLWKVLKNGETVARFKRNAAAERWAAFMKGERHTKGGR